LNDGPIPPRLEFSADGKTVALDCTDKVAMFKVP
jgi:hypothetical protein